MSRANNVAANKNTSKLKHVKYSPAKPFPVEKAPNGAVTADDYAPTSAAFCSA